MPELPEVETTRRGLAAVMVGRRLQAVQVRRADLRMPIPVRLAEALTGARVLAIRRRAKYLLIDLDTGESLLVHLGMSGSFRIEKIESFTPKKHDHVLMEIGQGLVAAFHDPRRFGVMDLVATVRADAHPLLAHLGPEPLSDDFSVDYLSEQLARRSGAIKPVLMDQKLVVGVGNIYASESLFLCKINPLVPSKSVVKRAGAIIDAVRQTLSAAIASGGSTLRDYVGASGEGGYFQHQFHVYGHENSPCSACGKPIQSTVQAGRATYWCASCQPLSGKRQKR